MEILKTHLVPISKKGTAIHIKKKNKGKFTDWCGGKVTSECIQKGKNSDNPTIRKRATFAENARHWKHQNGGSLTSKFQLGGFFSQIQDYWNSLDTDEKTDLIGEGVNFLGNTISNVSNTIQAAKNKQQLIANEQMNQDIARKNYYTNGEYSYTPKKIDQPIKIYNSVDNNNLNTFRQDLYNNQKVNDTIQNNYMEYLKRLKEQSAFQEPSTDFSATSNLGLIQGLPNMT